MSSVQFRNIPDVINALQSTGVVNWSIWQAKQFTHFKYTGEDPDESMDLLRQTCQTLAQSAAIYTLKLYEGLKYNKDGRCTITRSTEDSGSFNFRFLEETYGNPAVMYNRDMEKKMDAMTLKIQQLEAEKAALEEEEDDEDLMGAVTNSIKEALPMLLPQLMGKFLGGQASALAGVPGVINDLASAIEAMRAADPDTDAHLIKLGIIAKDNPKKFKDLTAMIGFL